MAYENGLSHRLTLDGRERLSVTGVEHVERFDETSITLVTTAGVLEIRGEELHIGKLSLDGGELWVEGRIDSLCYEEPENHRGFLQRLFG